MTQPSTQTRPAHTPLHVRGEVLSTKRIGAYRHLTLVAPGIAERHRPGTFVAVSVGHTRPRAHLARQTDVRNLVADDERAREIDRKSFRRLPDHPRFRLAALAIDPETPLARQGMMRTEEPAVDASAR